MVNKRFQVFVSSTYSDLMEERAEIMQALLELDCMPAGMELFPAASEEQWSWIKKVIDESDYYLVVLGGRYGTISKNTGISYTEMEYRYAVDAGKPVIAFLHQSPGKIESGKSESDPQSKKKLAQFRELVQQRLCKYWENSTDLGAKVSRSITQLIKHQPAAGWMRADQVPEDNAQEILLLKKTIEELNDKLRKAGAEEPAGIEGLSRGDDKLSIDFHFEAKLPVKGKNGATYWKKGEEWDYECVTTWDEVFSFLAPHMITPISEYRVLTLLNNFVESESHNFFISKYPENKIDSLAVYRDSFNKIKIQMRALKLVSIEDGDKWSLTPYGDTYMTKLLAAHRSVSKKKVKTKTETEN